MPLDLGRFSYSSVPTAERKASSKMLAPETNHGIQPPDGRPPRLKKNKIKLAEDKGNMNMLGLGADGPVCSWDPDVARLLKAVDNMSLEGVQALIRSGIQVNGHGGSFHETALHKAAQLRWVAGVKALLAEGASVYAKNQFGQNSLHYAAASQSAECISLLLSQGRPGVLDHSDMRGHTPLHDAASTGCVEAIRCLVRAGCAVQARDHNNETPLHKAAKARSIPSMILLLNAGADMGARNQEGESVLHHMLRQFPHGMEMLFDQCLSTNSPKIGSKTLEVNFNFIPVASTMDKSQNQVNNLKNLVHLGHTKLLNHPVCETFLLLKWLNVRKLFFIEVVLYVIYTVFATVLIFDKFVWTSNNSNTSQVIQPVNQTEKESINEEDNLTIPKWGQDIMKGLVIFYSIMLFLLQFLSILQDWLTWIRTLASILHAIIIVLVLLTLTTVHPFWWQHHLATILILLMWVECMLLIGRFPGCGIYVLMFTRVAKVFLKIFAIFFCMLLAFSFSFYVALHYSNSKMKEDVIFKHPILTFVKTLTMMIGELDFGGELVEGLNKLTLTAHLIYLAFVILVSIILANLLVALAVNDVQGLRNSAHLERLIKQTELVFQKENDFNMFLSLAEKLNLSESMLIGITRFCHYCKLDLHNSKFFMKPNHPQKANTLFMTRKRLPETKLQQHILNAILECLRAKETEVSNNRKNSTKATVRGGRHRRSEYNNNDSMKANLKELETNLLEGLSEKVEDVTSQYESVNTRLLDLENKIEKIVDFMTRLEKIQSKREINDNIGENMQTNIVNKQGNETKLEIISEDESDHQIQKKENTIENKAVANC